jgi:hypothetical protein
MIPFGVGSKMTSAEANAMDVNVTNALDKRAGHTDSLESEVAVASGGSVTIASGATLTAAPGSSIVGFGARMDEFLVSGTWTCPPSVFLVTLDGYGGGGGGGGGVTNSTVDVTKDAAGGGGGGGSIRSSREIQVTPGVTYAITIPAAAAGGAIATDAADAADVTFGSLAKFAGAQGGGSAGFALVGHYFSCGGCPVGGQQALLGTEHTPLDTPPYRSGLPSWGGWSVGYLSPGGRDGGRSADGFAGGAGGLQGSTSSAAHGGGGAGGGGGGPGGVGGAGGAGGNSSLVASTAGTAGTAAAANTGGGGGGGGAGGNGTGVPTGAAGGAGGTGRLRVSYQGNQAVVT